MNILPQDSATFCPRAIEFFAGIGGFAAACPGADIVAAIDINRLAESTYQNNHRHPYVVREIEGLAADDLLRLEAEFWWLSPPCQPYSRRGQRRDVDDPRSRPLLHLLDLIEQCRPRFIGFENVVGFADSLACGRLQDQLQKCGYAVSSIELCPSEMGWPNRRPRFYLLASQERLATWRPLPSYTMKLRETLLPLSRDDAAHLWLADETTEKYLAAMSRVDAADDEAVTACFAGSYGKAILRSGSYLHAAGGYRHFAPREVARLLGFPDSFQLEHLPTRNAWKLLGNSLSLPAVRYILSHFA